MSLIFLHCPVNSGLMLLILLQFSVTQGSICWMTVVIIWYALFILPQRFANHFRLLIYCMQCKNKQPITTSARLGGPDLRRCTATTTETWGSIAGASLPGAIDSPTNSPLVALATWSRNNNRGIPQGRRNRFLNRILLKGGDCYTLQIVLISFRCLPLLGIPQRMLVSGDELWEIRSNISVLKRIALDYSYGCIEDGIWTKYGSENVLHQLHFPSWERQLPDVDIW
jgi:hypothetical protein